MTQDAIVVGAGPAGSAAALELARSGARVRLIERSRLPRPKACGDGLTPRALVALEALGIRLPRLPGIEGVVVRSPLLDPEAEYRFADGLGTVISRFDLDARIASAATDAGADLRTSATVESLLVESRTVCGVSVRTPSGALESLRAPVTILAEGSVGALARQAPVRQVPGRRTVFAVRRYLEGVEWSGAPRFEILLPLEVNGYPVAGYAWVFPMTDGMANVGVGLFNEGKTSSRLHQLLHELETGLLREDPRFHGARPIDRPIGAPVRIGASGPRSYAPGLLLVGDSAGLPNPYWAEGISGALESGRLAAGSVMGFLRGESDVEAYGEKLADRYPNLHRFSPSLPTLYRNLRHHARDVVPFLRLPGRLSAAYFATLDAEPRSAAPTSRSSGCDDDLGQVVERIRRRARRIAGRDRPVFGELIDQADRSVSDRSSAAEFFLAARSSFPSADLACRELHRSAVVFELLRIACQFLGGVPDSTVQAREDADRRGGTWLASTLGLSLADRLLARCFDLTSRLPADSRTVVSDALLEVTEQLALGALARRDGPDERDAAGILQAAAARAGARLGGASRSEAEGLAQLGARLSTETDLSSLSVAFRKAQVREAHGELTAGP